MLDVVLLAANSEAVRAEALADSGADFCLFPLDLAKLLELDLEAMPTEATSGVGNAANLTYYASITIDLGDGLIFTTRVGFTEGMNRAGFGLLGQEGFFEHHNVEFRHRDRQFTVQPV